MLFPPSFCLENIEKTSEFTEKHIPGHIILPLHCTRANVLSPPAAWDTTNEDDAEH